MNEHSFLALLIYVSHTYRTYCCAMISGKMRKPNNLLMPSIRLLHRNIINQ